MTFQFWVSSTISNLDVKQCYPVDIARNGFTYEKEKEKFYFRKKIIDKFVFIDSPADGISDYSYLKSIEDGTHGTFDKYALCNILGINDDGTTAFRAKFEIIKCNFNNERRYVELEAQLEDDYTTILANKDKEYNVWDCTPYNVQAKTYSEIKFLITNSELDGGKAAGMWTNLTDNGNTGTVLAGSSYDPWLVYAREEAGTIDLQDTRQYKVDNGISTSTDDWFWDSAKQVYYRSPYVKFPNLAYNAVVYNYDEDPADNYNSRGFGLTPPNTININASDFGLSVPWTDSDMIYSGASICSTLAGAANPRIIDHDFDRQEFTDLDAYGCAYIYYATNENSYDIENIYTISYKARRLDEVIKRMIFRVSDGAYNDYVTNDFVVFQNIYLIDAFDFKNNIADNFTTQQLVKFEEFMEDLYLLFRAGWDIYEGQFRINQESRYLNPGNQLDLTTYEGGKYDRPNANYNYDEKKILGGFQLTQQTASTADFAEITEDYGLSLIADENNIERRSLNLFKTDLPYLLRNSQTIGASGIIMVYAADVDGVLTVGYQSQILSGIGVEENSQNGQLSLGNLAYYWWRENKPVKSYTVRTYAAERTYQANGYLPIKRTEIEFISGEEIDLYQNINISLGSGYIGDMKEYWFTNKKEAGLYFI